MIEAELVEDIAQRYHVLPTEVAKADADYLLRHIAVLGAAAKKGADG